MKGILTFFASSDHHSKCNQICASLGIQDNRLDNRKSVIKVNDELKFKNQDQIYIVCEFCQRVQQMIYQTYKQRMKSDYPSLACNRCFDRLKENKKSLKCNSKGCNKSFGYKPYFYEVMGLNTPLKSL